MAEGTLSGLRVVEFCDEIGSYCGRLLADLGAEVVKVEPPGGGRERHTPPFYGDEPGVDRSLAFWARNTSKRSVVLDLETPAGRADARRLAVSAAAVVEDRPVGRMASLGLGYGDLHAEKPSLVYASITGFGQIGPHATYAYSDIVGQAMSGVMTLAGHPDDPPNMIYGDQANVSAGIQGAIATLIALLDAEATGQGQHVDVSAQEALSLPQEAAMPTWDLQRRNLVRTGRLGPVILTLPGYGLYACRDGWVFVMVLGGSGAPFTELVGWLREKGLQEDLDEEEWASLCAGIGMRELNAVYGDPAAAAAIAPQLQHVQGVVERFFATMTAEEAYLEASERGLIVGMVAQPRDVARNKQLRARRWFVTVENPDMLPATHPNERLGATPNSHVVELPGPPYRLSRSPATIRQPPRLGEHTRDVLAALNGTGDGERHRTAAPVSPRGRSEHRLPLAGVRVADFSWYGVGPLATRPLALLGAEVVKVESEAKVDGLRRTHPFARNPDGTVKQSYNVSGYFNNYNPGKLSLQLNLNTEQGSEVAYRLIEASDIFVTNFAPGALDRWGLQYDQVARIKPDIIAAYAPMQGLEGPHRDFLGLGAILVPLVGLSYMTGFPHRPPIGVGTSYPDYGINPGHMTVAILAALRHRNRTGAGQLIELAQIESTANVMGTALIEHLVNGTDPPRCANRRPDAAPHGAFRCADDPSSVGSPDRWIAIACRDDREWRALCEGFGCPQRAADPRFATLAARKANEDGLDELITSLTRSRRAEDVMELLQERGVPAGVVQNAQDLLERDPHVAARGYYVYLDHPETGQAAYDGAPARFSETPASPRVPAPLLGEHTFDVCTRILGLTPDEVAELVTAGVLT